MLLRCAWSARREGSAHASRPITPAKREYVRSGASIHHKRQLRPNVARPACLSGRENGRASFSCARSTRTRRRATDRETCLRGISFEIVPPVAGAVRSAPPARRIPVQPSEYDKLDRMEDRMWWFAAMHANLLMAARQSEFDELDLPILDAGAELGDFFPHLARNYGANP